jgi:muramoyltetrapeptide carboxypeptidase
MLNTGDNIAIVAPSGPVDTWKLERGLARMRGLGLVPQVYPTCVGSHGYFSASDTARVQDLHAAFADPNVDAIICARGGYGAARLLPLIDFELVRANGKPFLGFSDITALHVEFNRRCGLVTYHAPMVCSDSFPGEFIPMPQCDVLQSGDKVTGEITGGNLAVLCSLLGTPWEICTKGKILFLEEVDEEPYRVDRLLTQLWQAGKLHDAAAIVLGDFSYPLAQISQAVQEVILPTKKPVLSGLTCGHCVPNIVLPMGGLATISTESLHALQIHDPPGIATARKQP